MTENPEARRTEAGRIQGVLDTVWQRSQPVFRVRVDLLRSAGQADVAGTLTPERRLEAQLMAHKLAGSLGMFGFPRGTELAREIESGLQNGSLAPQRFLELAMELHSMLFPDADIA